MISFLTRCAHCFLPLCRAIDILLCTIWLSLLYPFGLADRPTGRQLISGYVGKAAFHGQRWGLRVGAIIDWLATLVGDEPDHCLRAYLFWRRLEIEP